MSRLTLDRSATTTHGADVERAIGNDGLTDTERENYAHRYRTTGAGRPTGGQEREDVSRWLRARRAARLG